jgi:hypothetical protein
VDRVPTPASRRLTLRIGVRVTAEIRSGAMPWLMMVLLLPTILFTTTVLL